MLENVKRSHEQEVHQLLEQQSTLSQTLETGQQQLQHLAQQIQDTEVALKNSRDEEARLETEKLNIMNEIISVQDGSAKQAEEEKNNIDGLNRVIEEAKVYITFN